MAVNGRTTIEGFTLPLGQLYVAEREVERARLKATRASGDRPWWGAALSAIGAAAGFGLALVAMGAIVMWVRLVAVDVPAEQGLASSRSSP